MTLETLVLHSNALQADGETALAESLFMLLPAAAGALTSLDISHNALDSRGISALAVAVASCPQLQVPQKSPTKSKRPLLKSPTDTLVLQVIADGVSIDCSKPDHCESTCGSATAYFFIPFFVVLTNSVVMKLVIPPLMIEIGRQLNFGNSLPGTDNLTKDRFTFLYTRWRRQSFTKKYVLWVEEFRKTQGGRRGGLHT